MRFRGKRAWAPLVLFVFLAVAATTQKGAAAASNSGAEAAATASESEESGPGVDLKAIAGPKKPQTYTGFPEETLPGDKRNGASHSPAGKVVFSGDPLTPAIGPEMAGFKLDYICAVAGHTGYTLERGADFPASLDGAYTFRLMKGKRKISTLYFNRELKLSEVK